MSKFTWPGTHLERSVTGREIPRVDLPTRPRFSKRRERSRATSFRSGAESHVARILDVLDVAWEYETSTFQLPTGEQYTPDFWLPEIGTFVEVKSGSNPERMHKPLELARLLAAQHAQQFPEDDGFGQERLQVVLIWDWRMYHAGFGRTACVDDAVSGLQGWCNDGNGEEGANWTCCARCYRWAPWDELNGWQCRACGLRGKDARYGGMFAQHELHSLVKDIDDVDLEICLSNRTKMYELGYRALKRKLRHK